MEEMVLLNERYNGLTFEERNEFTAFEYRNAVESGMSIADADILKNFHESVNREVFALVGTPINAASNADLISVSSKILSSAKEQEKFSSMAARAVSCTNGNWYKTKALHWFDDNFFNFNWPISYLGLFNLDGKSDDCDYVFRSQNYNIYYKAADIFPESTASLNTLNWNDSTTNPAKEPNVGSNEARLEFLVGKGRVDFNFFGFNAPQRFASETKITLVNR